MFSKKATRQDAMRKTTVCYFFLLFCVFAFLSVFITFVEAQTSSGDVDKIKALLLRPTGWKADFGHGLAELIYEASGEKVVVKIKGLSRTDGKSLLNCERDVTITSNGIKHDGCRDVGITLLFDPKDQDYPFKGKSQLFHEYKLKAN